MVIARSGMLYVLLLLKNGSISFGDFSAAFSMLLSIAQPMDSLFDTYELYVRAVTSIRRIQNLFVAKLDEHGSESGSIVLSAPKDRVATIEFVNVDYRYPEATENALKQVNLRLLIKPARYAIVGRSGSGKSTLLHMITSKLPTTGEVRFNDRVLTLQTQYEYLNQMAYVPQQTQLFQKSIEDNIKLGTLGLGVVASIQDVKTAAQNANIEDFINSLSNRYQFELNAVGDTQNVSGGQYQRISIARALIRRPTILILDESTSALDLKTEREILATLGNLTQSYGMTLIHITHRVQTIQSYDHIYVMDNGELCDQGAFKDLEQRCSQFQELLRNN
jgi:ATP-binding cassette subfamily B protein